MTVSAEEFRAWLDARGAHVREAIVSKSTIGRSESYADRVAAYLPSNYQVTGETDDEVTIEGVDVAGWTLDGYVIPRLASGLISAREVTA